MSDPIFWLFVAAFFAGAFVGVFACRLVDWK